MPAGFELIDSTENSANSPKGTFTPRANQKTHRSVFVCVGGKKEYGWWDEHEVRGGITTKDGRHRLNFEEYKDPKTQKPHITTFNGMELKEFIVPVEATLAKEQYDAGLSEGACALFLRKTETPSSPNQVGVKVLESTQSNTVVTIPN